MNNKWLNKLRNSKRWQAIPAIALILLAGALIEILSLVQYNYTHRLLQEELDQRAENEMTIKAILVKGILVSNEQMMNNYLWPVQRQIDQPERIYNVIERLVSTNTDVMCSFVAFVPGHYPDRERMFEPCVYRRGDSIHSEQIASDRHDYTHREYYHQTVENGMSSWSDPYLDTIASNKHVTTYTVPVADAAGSVIGAFGIDLSTQGIIDTLNTKHRDPSTFFLLLTEAGKLISQPDTTHIRQDHVAEVVRMINDSTYARSPSISGHCKVITFKDKEKGTGYAYYANMRGKPHWQLVMVCYENEVFGKLKTMRRNLLLLMLAAFSLLGFILYRVNQYVKRLHQSRLSKERSDSELHIAKSIQSEMLPSQDIQRADVDVSGKQVTALEVGGDLYDYFVRDEKLYFCIGDVSGKGVPSSLVMAVVHSHFRSYSQHESNPARIMRVINETSCEGNETNMFVTLVIGVLDLPTGRLRYCNAGHDAPLIIDHGVKPLAVKANLPVGLFADHQYVLQETQLPREATLLLYTDGLTETMNKDRTLFGLQRIIDTTRHCMEHGVVQPEALMDTLFNEATRFADGMPQQDDLTMLTIHYHSHDEAIMLDERIVLSNDVKQVPELNNFVKSVADRLNLKPSLSSQLMLAVEEAVVNVMSYAYPMGNQGDITIQIQATGQSIKFVITDQGKAFDPTRDNNVDTSLSAEERPIGGLGILLVRSLMDSINYERHHGKNVLTLCKEYDNNNKQ